MQQRLMSNNMNCNVFSYYIKKHRKFPAYWTVKSQLNDWKKISNEFDLFKVTTECFLCLFGFFLKTVGSCQQTTVSTEFMCYAWMNKTNKQKRKIEQSQSTTISTHSTRTPYRKSVIKRWSSKTENKGYSNTKYWCDHGWYSEFIQLTCEFRSEENEKRITDTTEVRIK